MVFEPSYFESSSPPRELPGNMQWRPKISYQHPMGLVPSATEIIPTDMLQTHKKSHGKSSNWVLAKK